MKKILTFLLSFSLCLFVGCNGQAKKPEKKQETVAEQSDKKKAIVCWGDSITEGMGMSNVTTYPAFLQSNLGDKYKVVNMGVGGETTYTILARANAIDFFVYEDITFAKGADSVVVPNDKLFIADDGGEIKFKGKPRDLTNSIKAIIGENSFVMSYKQVGTTYGIGEVTLTRSNTDEALTLKKGTKASFDYSEYFDDVYCNISLMGANDGGLPADILINQYKKITHSAEKNLYIVPFYNTDYSAEFAAAFGKEAVEVRKYFQTDAVTDYGITINQKDRDCLSQNGIPAQFCYNNLPMNCHLNKIGYEALAKRLYMRGIQLSIW